MKWSELNTRQRDILVAENVMGWTQDNHERNQNNDGSVFAYFWKQKDGHRDVFSPSADLLAAWEVVDKMRQSDNETRIKFFDCVPQSIYAITPEAICRAALKAVGVDIE